MDAILNDLHTALLTLRRSTGMAQERVVTLLTMLAIFGIVTTAIGLALLLVRRVATRTLVQRHVMGCQRLGTC